jgi:Zn-finger nucleic acid-binding protein
MAKGNADLFTVECPCCGAELVLDAKLKTVIRHTAPEKPPTFADFETAVERQKTEAQKREEAYLKSVTAEKMKQDVLSRKFDELLKQAKDSPDSPPPLRDFDID